MRIKRYQIWSKDGLTWSDWFLFNGGDQEKWQLKNKQLNEYKEVTEEEWSNILKSQEDVKNQKYHIIKEEKKKNDGKSNRKTTRNSK